MLNKGQLHELSPIELLVLQKHIRLGQENLRNLLTKQEMEQIFHLATVPTGARHEILVDKAELAGTSSLVVNTIMTATLGAWMGLSGFLELSLQSKSLFAGIFSLAVLLGGYLGFQHSRLTKNKAQAAMDRRKLQDLEIAIIGEINKKRTEEIKQKTNEIIHILDFLGIQDKKIQELGEHFDVQSICLHWFNQLEPILKQKYKETKISEGLFAEIDEIRQSIQKKVEKEEEKDITTEELNKILKKLSEGSIQPKVHFTPWIKTNYRALIVGLIPTLFGGFSSLFVYLGGAPRLAKEMGQERLLQILVQPEIKIVEFIWAILVTAYFAFSFVHMNRKSFRRDQELAKIQVFITREENAMVVLDDRLLKIKEVLNVMQRVWPVFRFAKKWENG